MKLSATELPSNESSVRDFAVWWLRNRPFSVPKSDAVLYYDGFAGVTLFRHENFQVQLVIVKPDHKSPSHSHPNIDSVEYGLAGDGEGTFESDRNARFGPLVFIEPGESHTAGAGHTGGAFISIQKWINGTTPTSVELDWNGTPLDKNHAELLT